MRREMINLHDFNLMDGFAAIDKAGSDFIDAGQLHEFMRLNGFDFQPEMIDAFMRRIDTDSDKKLNYYEFIGAVMPNEPDMKEFQNPRVKDTRGRTSPLRGQEPVPEK